MPKYSQVSEVTGIVGASAVDSALLSCILWEGSHSLVRSRMPGGATSLGGASGNSRDGDLDARRLSAAWIPCPSLMS
jgi:hypothetical protein